VSVRLVAGILPRELRCTARHHPTAPASSTTFSAKSMMACACGRLVYYALVQAWFVAQRKLAPLAAPAPRWPAELRSPCQSSRRCVMCASLTLLLERQCARVHRDRALLRLHAAASRRQHRHDTRLCTSRAARRRGSHPLCPSFASSSPPPRSRPAEQPRNKP
jgi:hypothetical protein